MGTSSFNWTPGNSTKTHTANLINKKKNNNNYGNEIIGNMCRDNTEILIEGLG